MLESAALVVSVSALIAGLMGKFFTSHKERHNSRLVLRENGDKVVIPWNIDSAELSKEEVEILLKLISNPKNTSSPKAHTDEKSAEQADLEAAESKSVERI